MQYSGTTVIGLPLLRHIILVSIYTVEYQFIILFYLTIISRARMRSESIVKSNKLVKNIETKQLKIAKRDLATTVLVFKSGAFRC